jgi:hypothetical protein
LIGNGGSVLRGLAAFSPRQSTPTAFRASNSFRAATYSSLLAPVRAYDLLAYLTDMCSSSPCAGSSSSTSSSSVSAGVSGTLRVPGSAAGAAAGLPPISASFDSLSATPSSALRRRRMVGSEPAAASTMAPSASSTIRPFGSSHGAAASSSQIASFPSPSPLSMRALTAAQPVADAASLRAISSKSASASFLLSADVGRRPPPPSSGTSAPSLFPMASVNRVGFTGTPVTGVAHTTAATAAQLSIPPFLSRGTRVTDSVVSHEDCEPAADLADGTGLSSSTLPNAPRPPPAVVSVKLRETLDDDGDDHLAQRPADSGASGGGRGTPATVVQFAAAHASDPVRAPSPPSSGNSSPISGESSPSASTGGLRVGQIAPLKRPLRAPPASPLRVLIVDDIPFNQKALHMQLKIALGAATAATTVFDFAADGEKAVQMLQKAATTSMGAYHIVWMDLQVWTTLFWGMI